MKKNAKILVLLVTCLSIGFGYSQDASENRERLRFGVRAGTNLANVYDTEGKDFVAESKFGLAAGGFIAIPLGKFIGFQPEVLYSEKGFKATGKTLFGNYEFSRTMAYLDIPLQLQLKPINHVTVLVGPQFSYLLNVKNDFNGNTTTSDQEDINEDNYKKNIFGFVVGADVDINNFIIGVKGGWDINKSNADGNDSTPRYKNQYLQMSLGFIF